MPQLSIGLLGPICGKLNPRSTTLFTCPGQRPSLAAAIFGNSGMLSSAHSRTTNISKDALMAKTASAVEEEISRDCLNRLGHAGYMLDAAQGSVCIAERRYKKGASRESSISS